MVAKLSEPGITKWEWVRDPDSTNIEVPGGLRHAGTIRALDDMHITLVFADGSIGKKTAGGAMEKRARQIIADEERFSAKDDKNNVQLHALRLARAFTAQQILGERPLTTNPHPDSGGKA